MSMDHPHLLRLLEVVDESLFLFLIYEHST